MGRVVVIGGGASGMMAALSAARSGAQVLLLERNEKLGKKLYITGKGRCNYTNSAPMDDFFDQVVSNPRFLYSAFSAFTNDDMTALLSETHTAVREERGGRMFPASDHASDVTKALSRLMEKAGVSARLNTRAVSLLYEPADGEKTAGSGKCLCQFSHNLQRAFQNEDTSAAGKVPENCAAAGTGDRRVCGVRCADGREIRADAVILATGGLSYPATGSDGAGHEMAKAAGLTLVPCVPALVPLVCKEADIPRLQGLSLRNVTLRARIPGNKKSWRQQGELLFTHFGISGPLGLSLSSYGTRALAEGQEISCSLDLKPALSAEQLDARLVREIEEKHARQTAHLLDDLLPRKMIPVCLDRLSFDAKTRVSAIGRGDRREIVSLLKNFSFTVTAARGFSEAIITQGGISVYELDPKTMAARQVPGLFAAGELLDLDALTGGFNLQIAWSTGWLAGKSAAQETMSLLRNCARR